MQRGSPGEPVQGEAAFWARRDARGSIKGAEYSPGHTPPHVHISTHAEFCPRTRVLCSDTITLHPAPFPIPTEELGAGGDPSPTCLLHGTNHEPGGTSETAPKTKSSAKQIIVLG